MTWWQAFCGMAVDSTVTHRHAPVSPPERPLVQQTPALDYLHSERGLARMRCFALDLLARIRGGELKP